MNSIMKDMAQAAAWNSNRNKLCIVAEKPYISSARNCSLQDSGIPENQIIQITAGTQKLTSQSTI
jgi:hypothetical protein